MSLFFDDLFAQISDTILKDKFFITFENNHYIAHFVDSIFSGNVETVDGVDMVRCSLGSMYIYNGSEWIGALNNIVSGYISHKVTSNNIVFSSYDLYKGDKVFYYGSKASYSDVVTGSISSSMIINSLKQEIYPTVSLVTIAVIGYVAFRKAWNFITGGVRGA